MLSKLVCHSFSPYSANASKSTGKYNTSSDTICRTSQCLQCRLIHATDALSPCLPFSALKMLDLRRPIYKQTAAYGHFGRTDLDLSWEKTDKAEALKKYL